MKLTALHLIFKCYFVGNVAPCPACVASTPLCVFTLLTLHANSAYGLHYVLMAAMKDMLHHSDVQTKRLRYGNAQTQPLWRGKIGLARTQLMLACVQLPIILITMIGRKEKRLRLLA